MGPQGTLFNINHNLLCALGVGHPALTMVKEASSSAGFACKMTGAGGGGCAVTLLQSGDMDNDKVVELRSVIRCSDPPPPCLSLLPVLTKLGGWSGTMGWIRFGASWAGSG